MKRALVLVVGTLACFLAATCARDASPRWWKGNTHTHTLWSDGDGAPELVCDRYAEAGYDFLVLSDHNTLQQDERWFPIAPDGATEGERRLTQARVDELIARFGADAVLLRDEPAPAMRLKTLPELRARFEEPGELLLIQGEEVTGRVHVNGINLSAVVSAQFEGTIEATLHEYLARIEADGVAAGRPTAAHLNHPNFQWAVAPNDLLQVPGAFAFEVYNGHPAVHNLGGEGHLSTEELWDYALAQRLGALGREPVYGVATDDSHHYHGASAARANMQRGWVMVRAAELDANAITAALAAGDFYASTGVTLRDVRAAEDALTVDVEREEGVRYVTEFVGTRASDPEAPGALLYATEENPARYAFTGDELYVRARVVSDAPMAFPDPDARVQMAWTQPVVPE